MLVKLASVVNDSIVDGPGFRLAVFFQGCPHRCPGCHNPLTHDPDAGQWHDTADILAMARANPLLDGITLTGGEPLLQPQAAQALAEGAKALGLSVVLFTGYAFEDALNDPAMRPALDAVDLMIDGPFILDRRTLELRFRGSDNQRVLDVPKSLAEGRAVEAQL